MTLLQKLNKLDTQYQKKRAALFARMTRDWRYCNYQGCDECINNNGLVPSDHQFAGQFGPNNFKR